LDPEELAALQFRKLVRLVRRAYEDVPFYRDLYRQTGFEPGDLRSLEDLRRLPVITKPQLRQAGRENIVSRNFDWRRRVTFHTSGTTGEPFEVVICPPELAVRSLVDFRCLLAMGFRPRDLLVTVGPLQERKPSLHERLGLFRARTLPGWLAPEEQLRRLSALKPDILWCYPTALVALLEVSQGRLGRAVQPRFLVVSSEVLEPALRQRAEQEFRVPIFLSYAAMETGRIAAECPAHEGLHLNADHVLFEIVSGSQPAPPGETGVAVITTLNQHGMPLIRYRLGDLCVWRGRPCSCGCTLPLIAPPEGRCVDVFRFAGGVVLSSLRFSAVLRGWQGIERCQVIQERAEWVRVLLVPSEAWPESRRVSLAAELAPLLPPGVRLSVELVAQIEDTGPKFRVFVSRVN
jgi:phenylacetate-CoA ligase